MDPFREFAEALSKLRNADEVHQALKEILTPAEVRDLGLRWELTKRLQLKVTQRKIANDLHLSLCKITRGSKLLKQEDSVIKRMLKNYKRELRFDH